MKKILKSLIGMKYLWLLLFVCIFYFPTAISSPPEAEVRAIVAILGIDTIDDEFEVTAQILSPKASATYTENYEVKTAKEKSVVLALESIGVGMGKRIGLSNLECIIFGNSVTEDIAPMIDFISRGNFIGNNVILINTNETAKSFVETVNDRSKEEIFLLSRFATFNENNMYKNVVNLQTFLSSYYGPSKASACSYIQLKEEENSNSKNSGQGGESQGDSAGTGGGEPAKKKFKFENKGELVIIKNGKFGRILTSEERKQLSWFIKQTGNRHILLEDFNENNSDNKKIMLKVIKNDIKKSTSFKDNIPHLKLKISVDVSPFSVENVTIKNNVSKEGAKKISPSDELKKALEIKIKNDIINIFQIMQEENSDIQRIYETFDSKHRKNLDKSIKTEKEKGEFINKILLDEIDIVIKFKE